MRMWLVDPKLLCKNHLLGEHVELHMLVGSLRKGNSVQGFIDNGLIDLSQINLRHKALVKELKVRGYRHKSPLHTNLLGDSNSLLNVSNNIAELSRRCQSCKARIEAADDRRWHTA